MAGEVAKGFLDIEVRVGDSIRTVRQLSTEVNAFQLSLNSASQKHSEFTKNYVTAVKDIANATGAFSAQTAKISTAAQVMDKNLSKGQATLAQFFSAKFNKNGAIAAEVLGLARERVSALNTQVVATQKAMGGFQEVLKIKPLAEFSSATEVAAQKQQILSTMLKQGTTNLINFGKNVQWAGRQLMVGFTVPLTIFGNIAGKTFMDLEKQVVAFKKVYGDIFTTPAELSTNLEAVTQLGKEYTKYGIAVKDTIGLAAQAAAAGRKNADLTDAVAQATRLATLGQMDQNSALETTISLQSAFKLSGKELADSINFLNMVENQTVVSLQDLSAAIPRVAPVIVGLGGDVKDLSVFLAAMQEGGVDAAEGANALKSGLASLINPTKQATQMLAGMGINLDAIIQANKGDLMGTVMAFSQALSALDQFSRQQALEQVFGKFQYAKLGALFDNISRKGSQAQQVIATMGYSTEQLGATADKELKAIEQSFGVQLTGAIERFKLAIAPIGEIFVKNAIPIINMFAKLAENFNNLSDGKKQFIAIATAIVGVVIPAATMMLGLFMNLTGTITKFTHSFASFAKSILTGNIKKAFQDLAGGSKYLSLNEIDAAIAAQQLSQASEAVSRSFQKQASETDLVTNATNRLASALGGLSLAQMKAASSNPEMFSAAFGSSEAAKGIKTGGKGFKGVKKNSGGPIVPGVGNTDSVPAILTPGEFVVNKDATRKNYNLLTQINSGKIQGFNKGGGPVDAMELIPAMLGKKTSGKPQGSVLKSWKSSEIFGIPRGINQLMNNMFRVKNPNRASYKAKNRALSLIENSSNLSNKEKEILANSILTNTGLSGVNEQRAMSKVFEEMVYDKDFMNSIDSDTVKTRMIVTALWGKHIRKTPISYKQTSVGEKLLDTSSYERSALPVWGIRNVETAAQESFLSHFNNMEDASSQVQKLIEEAISLGANPAKVSQYIGVSKYTTSGGKQRTNIESAHSLLPFKGMPFKYNNGGTIPGSGNTDTVPAMLTPGEFVVNKDATAKNLNLLHSINNGKLSGFNKGGMLSKLSKAGNIAGTVGMFTGNPMLMAAGFLPQVMQMFANEGRFGIAKTAATTTMAGGGSPLDAMKVAIKSLVPKISATALRFAGIGGAVAALGIGIYKLNNQVNKAEKAGAEFTKAMYGSAKTSEGIAQAFGRQTFAQAARVSAVEKIGGQKISQEAQQASLGFVQSEAGKQMIADVGTVKAGGGNAIEALRNQLSSAIIAGAINTEEARAIAIEVGTALKDEKLAVGVSAEITKLMGPDGKDLLKNLSTITAEISPKINAAKLKQDAEKAYSDLNVGEKFVQLFKGGGEEFQQSYKLNQVIEQTTSILQKELEARQMLNMAYQEGAINLSEYNKQTSQISDTTKKSQDAMASSLGFTGMSDLVKQGQGTLTTTTGYNDVEVAVRTFTPQQEQARKVLQEYRSDYAAMLKEIPGQTDETVNAILSQMDKLGGSIFADLLSGKVSEMDIPILVRLKDGGMTESQLSGVSEKLNVLRMMPDLETVINLSVANESQINELYNTYSKFSSMKDIEKNAYIKTNFKDAGLDKFGIEWQKILDMPDSEIKTAAMVKLEVAAKLEADLTNFNAARVGGDGEGQIANSIIAKIKNIASSIKSLTDGAFGTGASGGGSGGGGGGASTDWLKYLNNRFDIVDKRLSLEVRKYQDVIDLQNRQNDLDQRSISLNQRALEQLSKEEEKVNERYNERISLLDDVAESNTRLREQENSRIDLARALAEGNVSTAAQIMGQISANEANYRIEDTRAALEKQREEDLKNLKVEVNGQLLTREQIQSNIDNIEEGIYQRNILIQDQQDKIYNIEQQRLANTREREKVETRIFLLEQRKAIVALQGKKASKGLSSEEKSDLKTYKDSYNEMAAYFNSMFGESVPQVKMYGGMIKKFAIGGTVPGRGMTDKVPAMLTPGEFVVRKSVAKANMPMLEMLNNGVSGPSYNVPNSSIISAPASSVNSSVMYNDTYNINVNVSGTNASPDDIANVVMAKLSQTNRGNIRSIRV